jgi:hypothetical protein
MEMMKSMTGLAVGACNYACQAAQIACQQADSEGAVILAGKRQVLSIAGSLVVFWAAKIAGG